MTSSAPAASGVTISAAGGSGMLTGGAGSTGLEGLFAALVGSTPTLAPTLAPDMAVSVQGPNGANDEGMVSVLLAGVVGSADAGQGIDLGSLANVFNLPGTTVQTDVQLGDAKALTVTGDAETVKNFVQQLQDVYQKLVVDGGLNIGQLSDAKDLAGALTKLGMSAEDAAGVAERIQTMMKLLKQQQDVDDATAGSLAVMMLTVMGQQQVPLVQDAAASVDVTETFGLQIVSTEQLPVSAGAATKMTAWQMRAGSDVTRDLLGLSKDAGLKEVPVEASDKVRKVEVSVTPDVDTTIAVAVPEVKIPSHVVPRVPVALDAMPSEAAQAATAVTTTGAAVKVSADEQIEAPKGETYYKLQADKNGVETLEAVKPTVEVKDASLMAPQTAQTPAAQVAAQAAAQAATDAGFAERVAQIQAMVDKAEVGKQVSVQMQPLLAEGGGTVRINLHPKDLGQITVDLKVHDGKVQGTIAASEPAVVEQLARELHSLRHGLADAGLKLGEQGINLMLSHQGNQGQTGQQGQNAANAQTQNGRGSGNGTGGNTGGETAELASNIAAWVAPDRMLDVNV